MLIQNDYATNGMQFKVDVEATKNNPIQMPELKKIKERSISYNNTILAPKQEMTKQKTIKKIDFE